MKHLRNPVLRRALRLWSRGLARCTDLRGECGGAVVELALVCAFFAPPLLLGTGQMGIMVYDSIEIANAAGVAAAYGMQSLTYAANTSGITTAAQTEASDLGAALSVTPTTYYACANALGGTQYTGASAQSNANAGCTGTGNHALEFVQVKTSATVTPSIHCPGLPASLTLTGSSVMEVEQ
jgi:Flp pilus assembly protein TadG